MEPILPCRIPAASGFPPLFVFLLIDNADTVQTCQYVYVTTKKFLFRGVTPRRHCAGGTYVFYWYTHYRQHPGSVCWHAKG